MTRILHLDASPRPYQPGTDAPYQSVSRMLSYEFLTALKAVHPGAEVIYRNLGHAPVPPLDGRMIAAAFTPPEARTPDLAEAIALSDALVDEFLAADIYVFGVPMYNFNVPAPFKAYVDQIVRVGRTFAVSENGQFQGLVTGKQMYVITTRGGDFSQGSPIASLDYQEPWIRTIFGFLGITDIRFVHTNALNMGPEAREESLSKARSEIRTLLGV